MVAEHVFPCAAHWLTPSSQFVVAASPATTPIAISVAQADRTSRAAQATTVGLLIRGAGKLVIGN